LKVSNHNSYNTYEGINKSKFLEQYLSGSSDTAEITMLSFVKNINDTSTNKRFEAIDMVLENLQIQNTKQDLCANLDKLVSKKA